MDNNENIIITREFNTTKDQLWKSWTIPSEIKKWWGPEGFYSPSIKVDLRVGGKYIYAMHGPKGTPFDKDMYSAGEYKEIVPEERMVVTDYFSDEDGNYIDPVEAGMDEKMPKITEVVTTFEALPDNKSRLTITYPRSQNQAEFQAMKNSRMEEGWGSSLDKLAKLFD